MEKIGRIRRSQSDWRELVERQQQSGLTVAAFCKQEAITAASLYAWRSRLDRGSQSTPAPLQERVNSGVGSDRPGSFIDLGSLGNATSRFEVRLDLGQGVLLHLVRG